MTDVPLLVVATARPELLERRPGWGGGKLNATTLALAPLYERRDRPPPRKRARNARSRCRGPDRTSGASRGKPVVRRAVRRALRRAGLDGRPHRARDTPGHHRRPPGRSQPGREEHHARRGGRGKGVLDRCARPARRHGNGVPLARAERLRSATEAVFGRRRERDRVCARACPRRRLRADPACRARRRSTGTSPSGSSHSDDRRITPRCGRITGVLPSISREQAAPTTPISSTAHASPSATQATARPGSTTMRQPHRSTPTRSGSGRRATANSRSFCSDWPWRCTRHTTRHGSSVLSRPPAMPCLQPATRNAPPRRRHTSHASTGIAVRMRSSASIWVARRPSPANRRPSRRRGSSPSPPASGTSRARPRKRSLSPRRRSRWRPSWVSRSFALTRSRRSA